MNIKNSKLIPKLIGVLVASIFTLNVSAEELTTLKAMVEKVITTNPEVQNKYHEYAASGYDVDIARSGYLPKADIVGNYRAQEIKDGGLSRRNGTAIPTANTELVLRQMIFDGLGTYREVDRLTHAQRAKYYELQSTMQNVSYDFTKTYIDTLRYTELLNFAKTNYVTHKQYYDKIKERVDAGVARRVDLQQAEGRLALAESNLLTEATNLHDTTVRMQRLLGEVAPTDLAPVKLDDGIQPSIKDALSYAYANNPDLKAAIENVELSKSAISGRKAKYYPTLDLQARKNLDVSNDGKNSTSAADLLALSMNFNLFNGGADKAAVSRSAEQLNQAHDLQDKACLDTRQVASIAYNDIEQLKSQLAYRDLHQKSIEEARDAYRKQFDIGQRTLLDLLDTENEYFQAKRAKLNAEYDVQNAYARLYSAQGVLLNKIGSSRQGLPEISASAYSDTAGACGAIAPEQMGIDKEALLASAAPLSTAPKREVKPVEKVVLGDSMQNVLFEPSSSAIKPSFFPTLDAAVETLKGWGDAKVVVAGHTDKRSTSSQAYNLKLSLSRAQSVREYLVSHGIDAKRLTIRGYGFDQPVADNDPKTGNEKNRRVELVKQ